MKLKTVDAGKLDVSDAVFGVEFKESLVHQAVVRYLAGARQGTKAQKNRSDVRGGGCKPWRQKGTGRARAGTIRSPIWRSGGVTFAARPRDFSKKLNKKMYRGALRSILSELVRLERLDIVGEFTIDQPKTKLIVEKLKGYSEKKILIVSDSVDENLYLSARNLPKVHVLDVQATDPVSLVSHEKVIMTKNAIKKFEEMLG